MSLSNEQKTAILKSFPLLKAFRLNLPLLKTWEIQVNSITSNDVLGQLFADIVSQLAIGDDDAAEQAFLNAALSLNDLKALGDQATEILSGIIAFIDNYNTLHAAMNVPATIKVDIEKPKLTPEPQPE